jgi:elongation factor G
LVAYVFKTRADPFVGRINMVRVCSGVLSADSHLHNLTNGAKERVGQLLLPEGKDSEQTDELGPGDIGAVAKLKETHTGDVLSSKQGKLSFPPLDLPAPVMAFAYEPKSKGDEEKAINAVRRLKEEDPTLDVHRDPQTGEQIIAGLSQIHVEVIKDRMKERYGAEIALKPPQVPYVEAIRKPAKAHARYKKQTGGRGQFADCHIELSPAEEGAGLEFENAIKGGVIPTGFIPAVEKGIVEAMQHGEVAGYPIKDVHVRLYDGQHHSVDSSEMAFKICGSMAFKQAMSEADPVLREPIMTMTISVPEDAVGDVIGDLNSRRGRPLGMEPKGGMTEVKAEVPMAEILDYAPDLRAITGGRGDYTMELERYEEIPGHLSQKVIDAARAESEERVGA